MESVQSARSVIAADEAAALAALAFDPLGLSVAQHAERLWGSALITRLATEQGRVGASLRREWLRDRRLNPDFVPRGADEIGVALRVALLDDDRLCVLARRLGISLLAPRLRRIVLRSELRVVEQWMTDADWKIVAATAQTDPGAAGCFGEDLAVAELGECVEPVGWAVLGRLATLAGGQIGPRLALRLSAASLGRAGAAANDAVTGSWEPSDVDGFGADAVEDWVRAALEEEPA